MAAARGISHEELIAARAYVQLLAVGPVLDWKITPKA